MKEFIYTLLGDSANTFSTIIVSAVAYSTIATFHTYMKQMTRKLKSVANHSRKKKNNPSPSKGKGRSRK